MAIRTSNPALKAETFTGYTTTVNDRMTLQGTVDKTFLLLMAVVTAAAASWGMLPKYPEMVLPAFLGSVLASAILSLVIIFNKPMAPILSPLYAICEGITLGVISAIFESRYPGIVAQAVGCTFGTLFCLLAAYRSKMIKPTENFKLGVFAATGGIAMFYLVSIVSTMLFHVSMPLIHSSGPMGIAFSLFVVVIAALNLVLDFDFIENGVECGAPKFMEWYAAFGLLVTLVWLYLEFLRLLAKLRSRD